MGAIQETQASQYYDFFMFLDKEMNKNVKKGGDG